jgi:hypothetical protein
MDKEKQIDIKKLPIIELDKKDNIHEKKTDKIDNIKITIPPITEQISISKYTLSIKTKFIKKNIHQYIINMKYASKVSQEMGRVLNPEGYALIKAGTIVKPTYSYDSQADRVWALSFNVYRSKK